MKPSRPLYLVLGSIAFVGWLLFILACTGWPAWSPDSTKILFPYIDQKADASAIALYDRQKKTLTTIYRGPDHSPSDTLPAAAQWTKDGKQMLVFQGFEDNDRATLQILGIPATGKFPIHSVTLFSDGLADLPPFAEANGSLYLALKEIVALDLTTWEVRKKSLDKKMAMLFAVGDRVMYMMGPPKDDEQTSAAQETSKQQTETTQAEKKPAPEPLEFGELDQKDLSQHPWFTVTNQQIAEFAKCDTPHLNRPVGEAGSERIAFTLSCIGKPDAILFADKRGLQQVVQLKAEGNLKLTLPQFSQDGKTLYAGIYFPTGNSEKGPYAIAEVDLASGKMRQIPITKLLVSDDDYRGFMRVSVSPDGSKLATTTALVTADTDIDGNDLALFIVDLQDPKRPVTKIHPPNWEAPKASEKKTP